MALRKIIRDGKEVLQQWVRKDHLTFDGLDDDEPMREIRYVWEDVDLEGMPVQEETSGL